MGVDTIFGLLCDGASRARKQSDSGFRYAISAEEALEMAFERQGGEAKVAVLQHGGHILPHIERETAGAWDG